MSEKRVQVTVTLELDEQQVADGCSAATFMGVVREALEGNERMSLAYGGKLVGFVSEVPGDPDSVHRHAIRVPEGNHSRTIRA